MKSRLKFFLKMWLVSPLRSFLLYFFGEQANRENWDKRLLIVNLEGMGDIILFTSVLKHYKRKFPEKEIWFLLKDFGIEKFFVGKLIDRAVTINYRKFSINPFYGVKLINSLRRVGFETVINHDFCAHEILGKIIAVELGAKEVLGYEGMDIEWKKPYDIQQEKNLRIVREKIFPRFTKIIPSIDKGIEPRERLRSAIKHYIAIYEGITRSREDDYAIALPVRGGADDDVENTLRTFGLKKNKYVIFNVGATTAYRKWPLFRFSKVAEFLETKGIETVIMGVPRDKAVADEFQRVYWPKALNLAGKTSLTDLVNLVDGSLFVFANSSSLVHIAVALRKPSICLAGGGQFGAFDNYGYADVNHWLWRKTDCYFDDWHCGRDSDPLAPAPCIEAVPLSAALKAVKSLLEYLSGGKLYPAQKFSPEFEGEMPPRDDGGKKLKVVYAGARNESYNPKRNLSFEYNNFYLTLKNMPGVETTEYQFDPIVTLGKERFNRELLGFIKSEKPDLFFAFMFSDELDLAVLEEIKKYTKTVAWFADDSWRFYNYSRRWYPYFTKNVTTYSWIPVLAEKSGTRNVIRSQWAANAGVWYPLEPGRKKDIDVSFVGQRNPERAEVVRALREAGINVFVRGWGWPEGKASQAETLEIVARSKIVLNINSQPSIWSARSLARIVVRRSRARFVTDLHVIENLESWRRIGVPQIKARPFELAACRAFVISGYADDLDNFYNEGEEMVFYRTTGDLIKKIKEYLPQDAEREKIAGAGYERTMREHTYEQRFRDVFRKIGLKYE